MQGQALHLTFRRLHYLLLGQVRVQREELRHTVDFDRGHHVHTVCANNSAIVALVRLAQFARKVWYIKDYVNRMGKLEKDYFEGSKSVEQVGRGMLGTKSMKYAIQNEFRLGIVFPYKKSN